MEARPKDLLEWISNSENLWWAWQKAKSLYKYGDIWFDEIEVARFEANIEGELKKIANEIKKGRYRVTSIRPMASPKAPDESGAKIRPQVRQMFWVSVRDQVAWLALLNVIGPYLDYLMPFWSYAYRLYIPMFYEGKTLKFGWYRHSTRHTYRKWNQSWPLYRKHIAITARIMAKSAKYREHPDEFLNEELEQDQKDLVEQNRTVPHHLKVLYLDKDYWDKPLSGKVYWAGIDFAKFYPSIKIGLFLENSRSYCPEISQNPSLQKLIGDFMHFPVDYSEWREDELTLIGLGEKPKVFSGIPTGLFVAGFIANVCLLDVDRKAESFIGMDKNIAHFRFVDDHVFLADSFEGLCQYLEFYEKTVNAPITGLSINTDKTEPAKLCQLFKMKDSGLEAYCEWLSRLYTQEDGKGPPNLFCETIPTDKVREELLNLAIKDTELDPEFLSPLMTRTLTKVSGIVRTDFELLDEDEEAQLIADLEHLLLTDFPDQELRRDTRVSFAASMLSRLVPRRRFDTEDLYRAEQKVRDLEHRKKDLKARWFEHPNSDETGGKLAALDDEIRNAIKEKSEKLEDLTKKRRSTLQHTFNLLLKAVKDNHSKMRLWVRLLEYCLGSGEKRLSKVFDLMEHLRDQHIMDDLSYEFLHALILQVLANLLTKAYRILSHPNEHNHLEMELAHDFMFALFDPALLRRVLSPAGSKFYLMASKNLLRFSLVCVSRLLEPEDLQLSLLIRSLKSSGLFREEEEVLEGIDKDGHLPKTHDLGAWIWWAVRETSDTLSTEPNLLWTMSVRGLSSDNPTGLSVIMLYPASVPEEKLLEMAKSQMGRRTLKRYDGWLLDAVEARREFFLSSILRKNVSKTVAKLLEEQPSDRISLFDWARWCKKRFKTLVGAQFDPRLSEWTCLEIVRQVAVMVRDSLQISRLRLGQERFILPNHLYSGKIHPANYMVLQSWTDAYIPSWDEWDKVVDKDRVEKRLRPQATFVSDPRYTPTMKDVSDLMDTIGAIIHGLGVLLWGLLVKDFSMPPFTNPLGFSRIWAGLYRKSLTQISVSSRTLALIAGCFSNKNRETRFLRLYQAGLFDDPPAEDTVYDPPDIVTIDDFLREIKKAQFILKRYRLTVQDHQPRQLIPINLAQETRHYDPWKEVDNE